MSSHIILLFLLASAFIAGAFIFLYYTIKILLEKWTYSNLKTELFLRQVNAAERMVLFLERSHPLQLKRRCPENCKTATDALQFVLLSLEEEFFHNVVQQLYLPWSAWEDILNAKNQLQEVAMAAFQSLSPQASKDTFFDKFHQLIQQVDVDYREEARKKLHYFIQQTLKP